MTAATVPRAPPRAPLADRELNSSAPPFIPMGKTASPARVDSAPVAPPGLAAIPAAICVRPKAQTSRQPSADRRGDTGSRGSIEVYRAPTRGTRPSAPDKQAQDKAPRPGQGSASQPAEEGVQLAGQTKFCTQCDREFASPYSLLQHNHAKHGGPQPPPRTAAVTSTSVPASNPAAQSAAPSTPRRTERERPQHKDDAPRREERRGGGGGGARGSTHGLRVAAPNSRRNTVCFQPTFERPDLRLVTGAPSASAFGKSLTPWDVVMVPEFACPEGDCSLYDSLLRELKESGKEEKGLWELWHGDSHMIANDRKGWKSDAVCPTFQKLVARMSAYFGMKVNATRLNWYRDDVEWKPFHFDRAAFTPGCPQNFTAGLSLGPSTRDISFEHAGARNGGRNMFVSLPQPNGSMYGFSRDVNIEWRHGVPQLPEELRKGEGERRGRISIICWGELELDEREF